LPSDLAEKVFETIHRVVDDGRSVLFISHRLEEVIEHCSTCTVFRDGYTVDTFAPGEGGEARIVSSMLGENAQLVREEGRRSRTANRPAASLQVRGLSRGILQDVTFDAYPGEVLGIVAMEGQGQEELFGCLSGDKRPTGGTIEVDGTRLAARHPADAIRKGVVLVPADRVTALLPQRPIRESIALPLYARVRKWGVIDVRSERTAVSRVIDRLSIDIRAATRAKRLSGGNQQKLTIARWLAAGFKTLLLLDPTRGIDVGTKHQIYDVVREVADSGVTVVMYTSELREINLVCDRAIVLNRGRIVAELPPNASEEELLTAAHSVMVETTA
jgi:ribose transport system ATP-binding protein